MRSSFQVDAKSDRRQRHSPPRRIEDWQCWGLSFLQMVSLKTLTIDFEIAEDKRDEAETLVHWARQTWRFPVLRRISGDSSDPFNAESIDPHRDDRPVDLSPWSTNIWVLTAEDNKVKRSSWRSLPGHFARYCPACRTPWQLLLQLNRGCSKCDEKQVMCQNTKRPQLLLWSVIWTPKPARSDDNPRLASPSAIEVQTEGGSGRRPGTADTEGQDLTMSPGEVYILQRERQLADFVHAEVYLQLTRSSAKLLIEQLFGCRGDVP